MSPTKKSLLQSGITLRRQQQQHQDATRAMHRRARSWQPRRVLVKPAVGRRAKETPQAKPRALSPVQAPCLFPFKFAPSSPQQDAPQLTNQEQKDGSNVSERQQAASHPSPAGRVLAASCFTPAKTLFVTPSRVRKPERDHGAPLTTPRTCPLGSVSSKYQISGKDASFFSTRLPQRVLAQRQNVCGTPTPIPSPSTLPRRVLLLQLSPSTLPRRSPMQDALSGKRKISSFVTPQRCSILKGDRRRPLESGNCHVARRKLEGLLTEAETPRRMASGGT